MVFKLLDEPNIASGNIREKSYIWQIIEEQNAYA